MAKSSNSHTDMDAFEKMQLHNRDIITSSQFNRCYRGAHTHHEDKETL